MTTKAINQNRIKKETEVTSIQETLSNANICVFAEYRGLDVESMSKLRSQVREMGGQVKVSKNTLTRRASAQAGLSFPDELLTGPIATISTSDDSSKVCKSLLRYAKENESLQIKGGVFENQYIDLKMVKQLASLPSKETLIASSIQSMKAPIFGFVRGLSSPLNGLVYALQAIQNKKTGGES